MRMLEEDPLSDWNSRFETGTLLAEHIRNYWKYQVPKIYSPPPQSNGLRLTHDENEAQQVLFDPLEKFMCGGNVQEACDGIRSLDQPPSLCGRVFRTGDPTYGCRDCGMDPTCVLCADCFEYSAHSKHRYKISTSAGGGYCDCGDKEAWKKDASCVQHSKGVVGTADCDNALDKLHPNLVERVKFIFGTTLHYASKMLSLEGTNLPNDLQLPDTENGILGRNDTYVTILYNDETHTYDQVINALERSIDCTKREAVAYATIIDREGRCIVRCSTFHSCSQAKDSMDKPSRGGPNKQLKVQVIHTSIIAHQIFASKLLSWLHKFLEMARAFRQVFTEIMCTNNYDLIESIFNADTQMWKSSRIQWHRLFISGMLMDLESKKVFARIFTKRYSKMMKDFIQDDHEHSVCIVSLAVQLYTMPTIAHMLIAEEDVLARLMVTFLSECAKNTKNDKLNLESNGRQMNYFKRIQYILYDLKYLLGFTPEVWTPQLRTGFLSGFDKILKLHILMQGMDPMVRQVSVHLEFETEWEASFNLHIKIAYIIPLVIEWIASDREIFIKAFRLLLKKLSKEISLDMKRRYVKELLDFSVSCIEYEVSMSPVSLHYPLSRLLAGLMLKMNQFNLDYNSPDFAIEGRPSPEELMEPILRLQVMVAQVNAGMWKRNGLSLTAQLYFYKNVRCRQEMFDKDIILMQHCASLIEANEFLIHIINRYGLLNWARSDYEVRALAVTEENKRRTVLICEEFFMLILMIVSERYTVGIGNVTEEDCLKKEIIQLLCIEAMPHSNLNKSLPENANHETGIEKVINSVASFRKSTDSKGIFELKKEYRHLYNQYFYHYTKEEQSKSESLQRLKKKSENEDVVCPPPPTPPFTDRCMPIVNIMQCDVFLHLIQTIIERFKNPSVNSVSDSLLQIALHLIGCALYEEERFIRQENPYFSFTTKAKKFNIKELLEKLIDVPRLYPHENLLNWILNRYNDVINLASGTHFVEPPPPPTVAQPAEVEDDSKRKADLKAMLRQKIMNSMASMQKKFINKNETLFKEACTESKAVPEPKSALEEENVMEVGEIEELVAVGPNQSLIPPKEMSFNCMLCHQEETLSDSDSVCMVYGSFIQKSTVLSRNRSKTVHAQNLEKHDSLVLGSDLSWGIHIGSCGHVMHAQCWQRFFDDVSSRERRRAAHRNQNMAFDIERNEYMCPLCDTLGNTALPILPPVKTSREDVNLSVDEYITILKAVISKKTTLSPEEATEKETSPDKDLPKFPAVRFSNSLRTGPLQSRRRRSHSSQESTSAVKDKGSKYKLYKLPELDDVMNQLSTYGSIASAYSSHVRSSPTKVPDLSPFVSQMCNGFGLTLYTLGLDVEPNSLNLRILEVVHSSTAYSITSMEQVQRSEEKSLLNSAERTVQSLTSLVRYASYAPTFTFYKSMAEKSCARLLSMVFETEDSDALNFLEWDSFSLMVSIVLSLPSIYPKIRSIASGKIQDFYIMHMCYFSYILQVLLTVDLDLIINDVMVDFEEDNSMDFTPSEMTDEEFICDLFLCLRSKLQLTAIDVNSAKLLQYVKEQTLPFLRCCGLFFHFLTDVSAPQELQSTVWVPESEYLCLLRYLGLDVHLAKTFTAPCFKGLMSLWCEHPRISKTVRENLPVRNWTHINKLIKLPKTFTELINSASQFPCPATFGDDSHTPAMCLMCGQVLCSQSYCCRMELPTSSSKLVGACTYHSHFCGAGTGVFVRVRDCRLLLLSGRIKGGYYIPPYLDEYGESDEGLKRGNPLTLDEAQYSKIQSLWSNHLIPTQIARYCDNPNSVLHAEWYYL